MFEKILCGISWCFPDQTDVIAATDAIRELIHILRASNQNLTTFKAEFGAPNGDYSLGNDAIRSQIQNSECSLLVQIQSSVKSVVRCISIPPSSWTLSQLVTSSTLVAITEILQMPSPITTECCSRHLIENTIPGMTTVLRRISEETGNSTVLTLKWISVRWQALTGWHGTIFLLLNCFLAATCG